MKSYVDLKKKKGFTLIELLAVIVILAILALIAIPIVISIIKDSRKSSAKRSVDSFGRAAAAAMSNYMTKNDMGDYSSLLDEINSWDDFVKKLNIKYSGTKVRCRNVCISPSGAVAVAQCAAGKDAAKSIDNGSYIKNDDGTIYKYTSGEALNDTSSIGTSIYYTVSTSVYGTQCYSDGCYGTWYNTNTTRSYWDTSYVSADSTGTSELISQGFRCKPVY